MCLRRECVTDQRESSFRAISSTLFLIGEKWKLFKLVYSVSQFFHKFLSALSNICEKNRARMINNHEIMMIIGYVKRTASRKTEQSKLRWKDKNSSTNSRSFKVPLVNKRIETWSSPGYTNKKRASYVYHVEFPHILKEQEVKTVQSLCCIFSIKFVCSSIFNKFRHFFVLQTTLI